METNFHAKQTVTISYKKNKKKNYFVLLVASDWKVRKYHYESVIAKCDSTIGEARQNEGEIWWRGKTSHTEGQDLLFVWLTRQTQIKYVCYACNNIVFGNLSPSLEMPTSYVCYNRTVLTVNLSSDVMLRTPTTYISTCWTLLYTIYPC